MLQEALRKINAEAADPKAGPYVAPVAALLQRHIQLHPEHAAAICNEGKTIAGGINAMRDVAKQRTSDGIAYISDEEGLRIVLRYFGVDVPEPTAPTAAEIQTLGITADDLL